MHGEHDHELIHAIRDLAAAVRERSRCAAQPLATKADLEKQTERVLVAINAIDSKDISSEDKAALAGLLLRSERFTAKMEALDQKTP